MPAWSDRPFWAAAALIQAVIEATGQNENWARAAVERAAASGVLKGVALSSEHPGESREVTWFEWAHRKLLPLTDGTHALVPKSVRVRPPASGIIPGGVRFGISTICYVPGCLSDVQFLNEGVAQFLEALRCEHGTPNEPPPDIKPKIALCGPKTQNDRELIIADDRPCSNSAAKRVSKKAVADLIDEYCRSPEAKPATEEGACKYVLDRLPAAGRDRVRGLWQQTPDRRRGRGRPQKIRG